TVRPTRPMTLAIAGVPPAAQRCRIWRQSRVARFAHAIVSGGLTRSRRVRCCAPGDGSFSAGRNRLSGYLLAILLDARRAQPGQAVLIDRVLPGKKLFDR